MFFLKKVFLAFFLIFLASLNNENLFASPKSEMLCQGWLGKLHGNNGQRSCKIARGNKEEIGKCSSNPSYSHGDHGGTIYEISDIVGVQGTCRDYFPIWGQREFFYRESSDPFKVRLVVMRQYCWARFPFSGNHNCGAPKYKFPFTFTWSHGGAYASWGSTKKKTFTLAEIGKNHRKAISWLKYAYIDYAVMKDKNGNIIKDENGKKKKNPKIVCAYYLPTSTAGIFIDEGIIGCVDIPLMPAPPIFNKVLVPRKIVGISNVEPDNNVFDKPKINLTVFDANDKDLGPTTTLTYDFNKTDDNQECATLLEELFCPTFSSTDATKICAKRRGTSDVLGCIDRKTPSESGVKIEAMHSYYMDADCNSDPKKPSVFQSLRIKLTNSDGTSAIYPSENPKDGVREYYTCTKKISDPKDPTKMIDMITAEFGSADVLGVSFGAIIPQFQIENPEKFKKIYLYPPQISQTYPDEFQNSCENCFVISSDSYDGQAYIVPAGKRDRNSCRQNYKCINFNTDPQQEESCTFGYQGRYSDAEKAYCSGVYIGADDSVSTQDKICIKLETDWENFFGPNDNQDNLCADIPRSYMGLSKDDISAITGYADFSDDGYDPKKTYPINQRFYGKCHTSLGLEETKQISDYIPKIEGLDDYQMLDLKSKYALLKRKFTEINANVPLLTKQLLSLLNLSVRKLPSNIQTVTTKRPYRTLDGNFPLGNIHNPCKFISGEDGCTNTKDTRDFLGNADYTLEDKLEIGHSLKPISNSITDWNTGLITTDLVISGKCRSGFASPDIPSRICRVITNKDNKIISKAWTNSQIIDPCLKSG